MGKVVLALLLAVGMQAQTKKTPHSRNCDLGEPEPIPRIAVEPVRDKDQQPWCPRAEYELKWYLSEEAALQTWTGTTYWVSSCGCLNCPACSTNSTPTMKYLIFKPMCVPKPADNKTGDE